MAVDMKVVKKYILPGYLTIFHIAFIILLAFFSKYYNEAPSETNLYASESSGQLGLDQRLWSSF